MATNRLHEVILEDKTKIGIYDLLKTDYNIKNIKIKRVEGSYPKLIIELGGINSVINNITSKGEHKVVAVTGDGYTYNSVIPLDEITPYTFWGNKRIVLQQSFGLNRLIVTLNDPPAEKILFRRYPAGEYTDESGKKCMRYAYFDTNGKRIEPYIFNDKGEAFLLEGYEEIK